VQVRKIDWYVDGTLSLKGFVKDGSDTQYVYFTRAIQEGLSTLFPEASKGFHRFGKIVRPFNQLVDAWLPSFYSATKDEFDNTDLTAVTKHLESDDLAIIVTDLYPDRSDFGPFRQQLIEKGLGTKFQFGIIACKLDFDGWIYDIPPNHSSQKYPHKPRPIYAIFLGPQQAIASLIEEVQRHNQVEANISAALFSNSPGKLASEDFSDSKYDGAISFQAPGFDKSEGLIRGGKRTFARQLRLVRSAKQPHVKFQAAVSFEPYEVVPTDQWHIEREVRMCSDTSPSLTETLARLFGRKETKDAAISEQDSCPVTTEDYEILYPSQDGAPDMEQTDKRRLIAPVTLDFGKRGDQSKDVRARPGKLYVVDLKLSSDSTSVKLPGWVGDFSQSRNDVFDGSRTTDLDPFLQAIGESVLKARHAVAMDVCFYIDSK